jgi:hypothetical protein
MPRPLLKRPCYHLRLRIVTALGFLSLFGGCQSQSSPYDALVQGSVTIDGQLAQGGVVSFYPKKTGPAAVGEIAENGSYSLRVGQGNVGNRDLSKIPSGQYVATVLVTAPPGKDAARPEGGPLPLGPRLMADKYADRQTSDLAYEVKNGLNVIDLKLEGPAANPPKSDADAELQSAPAASPQKAQDGTSNQEASRDSANEGSEAPRGTDEKRQEGKPTVDNPRSEDAKP